MLIIGAGGLAAQMIDDIEMLYGRDVVLWSEVEPKYSFLKENFSIIGTDEEVREHFLKSNEFVVAVGSPAARAQLVNRFLKLGGRHISFISPGAKISRYAEIADGGTILHGAIIEAAVKIECGTLVNAGAIITHGCTVGEFCDIAPGVILNGDCSIGNHTFIGAGATLIPRVSVGDNVVIGGGALITKNIPDNVLVAGAPGRAIKQRTPINFSAF